MHSILHSLLFFNVPNVLNIFCTAKSQTIFLSAKMFDDTLICPCCY